jgi:hypothetical protein
MNTENRVLAMLNKIGNVRTAKKENLGVIEDAINEAQNNISVQVDNFESLLYTIQNDKERISDGLLDYAMQAREVVNTVQSFYDEYEAEYLRLTEELDTLGINYNGISTTVLSDLKDAIAYVDGMADINI